ncbi:MAG: efflux RND transporter permease subunit [Acidobacteriaceae bacterium]
MNISAPFIRRPVATTLLTMAIIIAGAIAYTVLPVSPLPQIDFPTIIVQSSLPGGSAQIMASSVATPLERQLGHIAGISEMTSTSSLGSTRITLQFDLSRNIDGAARDVQAAINASRTFLPANLPSNPTWRKSNPADSPIMILGLTSKKYNEDTLYDEASTILEQKLSEIPGVGEVRVGGSSLPAVRVDVNPTQLNSYGLTLANVRSVLSQQNADLAKGQLSNGSVTADILANDQLSKASEYRPLIIGFHNGAAVRLSDVAQVTDSSQDIHNAGYLNGIPSVTVIIYRQPGANIIKTNDTIRSELPFLQAVLPQGINTVLVMDRTTTIRASVDNVEQTLIVSVILVVLVVFMFLRNWHSTLIPSVAVPASLIGTFAVMYLFGYSLDNLSLMALTISTGFVVDDAIVVMENITRYLEQGMTPVAAAMKGSREIGSTIFTMSMSLIAVFIPILLMGGIVGRLFREFAVTLATTIVISMIISLTTTPMMCAHILKGRNEEKHGALYRASENSFNKLLAVYRHSLAWVLDNPFLMLIVLLLIIALNVVVVLKIPKGFFPRQDTGVLVGGVQGPQDASFDVMNNSIKKIVKVIKTDPAVENVNAYVGSGNGGFIFLSLKPRDERTASADQIINRLRPKLDRLTGASVFLQAAQDLRIGGRSSSALYQYTLQSGSVQELAKWGPILLTNMRKIPGFQDVNTDQQNGGLEEYVTYDRATAARLGLTSQALDSSLYDAFGQSLASVIYTQLNQYYVVLEAAPQYWQSPAGLDFVYPSASARGVVPLRAVSTSQETTTPLQVNHTGLFPSVTISFNLASGLSLSDATARIIQMQEKLNAPATLHGFFSGTLQAYQQSLKSEPILVLTALLAVYIVLGVLYESLIHPLTIISTLPSASIGAMLALMLFHIDLNVISIIGIVLLIGIVEKNAIMMIDFALVAEREDGMSSSDAIFEACMLRFRPILMTTMAALFGALPLAFGTGTGSELRQPLGITIVGGLIVSQALTLYTTPVIYLYMDRLRLALKRKNHDTLPATLGEAT